MSSYRRAQRAAPRACASTSGRVARANACNLHLVDLHAGRQHRRARDFLGFVPRGAHDRHRLGARRSSSDLRPRRQRVEAAPRHQQRFRRIRMPGLGPVAAPPRTGGWNGSCGCCSRRRRSGASAATEYTSPNDSGVGLAPSARTMSMKMSDGGTRILRPCEVRRHVDRRAARCRSSARRSRRWRARRGRAARSRRRMRRPGSPSIARRMCSTESNT